MKEFVIHIINAYGYFGILILTVVESIVPIIPAEFILTLGGVATTVTKVTKFGVVLFASLGELMGALVLYTMGHSFSQERLERLAESRVGHRMGLNKNQIQVSRDWFLRKGKYTVLFSKCIPVIGSLISIPAGMAHMNLFLFVIFTLVGITIWNTVLVLFGVTLKESFDTLVIKSNESSLLFKGLSIVFLGCFIIVLVYLLREKFAKKRKAVRK